MARVVGVEEDEEKKRVPVIDGVTISNSAVAKEDDPDPFKKSIKEIDGIGKNLRRKVNRDLKKTYTGQEETKTKQIEEEASGYNYLDVVEPTYNLDWLAKLPAISSYHYAAIRAKEANIVGLGYRLVESSATKRRLDSYDDTTKLEKFRKRLARENDTMLDYLEGCNDDDSLTDTLGKAWFDYESTGQGYIEIGRKRNGVIGYIGHIPSTTIRVRRQRDGYVQIVSNKAIFFRNFGDRETTNPFNNDDNPNEIIMLKKYSATDSFYGLPDIMSASQALAGNEFAGRYNLDYFENKAVPRHVIILKGAEFSTAAERKIIEFFETGLKGQNHRSLFIPLPGDRPDEKVELKIEPVETGVQDQSFEKYKRSNLEEILFAHRVPMNKIGITQGMSIAAALDASKTFKEQVCTPQQRFLAKKLNKIVKELTDVFVVEFNELTLTDEDTQSKIDDRYLKDKVILPNEIRARMGLPGIKGGDEPLELKPQQQAERRADAGKTRQEDTDRSAATTTTNAEGRNPQGEGRRD